MKLYHICIFLLLFMSHATQSMQKDDQHITKKEFFHRFVAFAYSNENVHPTSHKIIAHALHGDLQKLNNAKLYSTILSHLGSYNSLSIDSTKQHALLTVLHDWGMEHNKKDLISAYLHYLRNKSDSFIFDTSTDPLIDNLENSRVKKYIQTICAALQPNLSSYEYFRHRKKLHKLHDQDNDLEKDHPILFENLSYPYHHAFTSNNSNTLHTRTITKQLQCATISNNVLAGYINIGNTTNDPEQEKYRLYVYKLKNGYPQWAGPVLNKKQPFAIDKHTLYCTNNSNDIEKRNKKNGSLIAIASLSTNPKEIHSIIKPPLNNHLIKILKTQPTKIAFIDLDNNAIQQVWKINNLSDIPPMIGSSIALQSTINTKNDFILIIDPIGSNVQLPNIPYHSYTPHIWGNDNVVFYVREIEGGQDQHILCFNRKTGENLLHYPLIDDSIITTVVSSKEARRFFVSTKHKTIAIASDIANDHLMNSIIWSKPHETGGCIPEKLQLSEDEKILYGFGNLNPNDTTEIIALDAQTGDEDSHYTIAHNDSDRLLGIYKGKLYMQSQKS